MSVLIPVLKGPASKRRDGTPHGWSVTSNPGTCHENRGACVARQASRSVVVRSERAEVDERAQTPWQIRRPAGMSFAVKSDIRFNIGGNEATWVLQAGTFTGLDIADRQALSDWLDDNSSVDTIIDLADRSWNIARASTILGVFESNSDQASWLIVRYGDGWTLARLRDSFISDVLDSLPNILRLIDEQYRA